MRAVKALVYTAFLLILGSGAAWVWARITHRHELGVTIGRVLIGSLYVAGAALVVALIVGLYHLYLYIFTDRRPLGFFETTSKDDGEPAAEEPR